MSTTSKNFPAKTEVKLGSNCIICEDSKIVGDVTVGNGTIIHPRACIIAEDGPIIIGDHNIIEDKTVIINKAGNNSGSSPVMTIGNYNVFEVGSKCEALKVGDNNVLEAKSVVGREVIVSNNCIIGAGCHITSSEILAENSTFYGPNSALRLSQGHPPQILQMDFLSKVLPSYHYLKKKKKVPVKDPNITSA